MRVRKSLDPWQWDPPFSQAEIGEMEQRVTNRENQLFRMIRLDAGQVILDNQRRLIREAQDRLGFMAERPGPPTRISRAALVNHRRLELLGWRRRLTDTIAFWLAFRLRRIKRRLSR